LSYFLLLDSYNRQRCVLALIDLDNFRYINEVYGYKIGDELLKTISQELVGILKGIGILYRFNGSKFIILFNTLDPEIVKRYIYKVIKRFERSFKIKDMEFFIPVNLGVYFSKMHEDIYEIIRKAETAMYESKKSGKYKCTFYNDSIEDKVLRKGIISNEIRKSIVNDELKLLYQPIFNLKNKRFEELEVLLRWKSRKLGEIPPVEFIPIAEENGFIKDLGYWVIEKACYQQKIWKDKGISLKLNINVSPVQLKDKDFFKRVKEIITSTGGEYKNIKFEITETQILENEIENVNVMKLLKKIGIVFLLDDFGAGYSSIKNLVNFPVNEVKIDKYFINNMLKSEKVLDIIRLFIVVSHKIGYKVIAEGVENKEEVILLEKLGCDKIQGYYISKPIDEEKILLFLSNSANYIKIL